MASRALGSVEVLVLSTRFTNAGTELDRAVNVDEQPCDALEAEISIELVECLVIAEGGGLDSLSVPGCCKTLESSSQEPEGLVDSQGRGIHDGLASRYCKI
jgi:hypothetical protein